MSGAAKCWNRDRNIVHLDSLGVDEQTEGWWLGAPESQELADREGRR
jgi:hypothetical protein